MSRILLNGSPRTAARQLVELLTRDGILDEDGNLRSEEVEAACRYANTRSPAATNNSTPKSRNETPAAISEPCSEADENKPDDTSRTQSPRGS